MKKLFMLLILLAFMGGCATLQWPASESIKQAGDMLVTDLQTGNVNDDTIVAAKIVYRYVGPPKEPIKQEAKQATLAQAQKDAALPPPTILESAEIGLGVADGLLKLGGALAAAIGLPAGVVLVNRARRTTTALREVIQGNDDIVGDNIKEDMMKAQITSQSNATRRLVRKIRKE